MMTAPRIGGLVREPSLLSRFGSKTTTGASGSRLQCTRSAVDVSHILGVGGCEVAPLRGRHRAIPRSFQGLASVDVALEELAGLAEIAEMLRVSRSTAARYAERGDFPAPIGRLGRGRIWRRRDVEKWGRLRLPLPKPGRPKKTPKHG